ncbi:hypothetical protein DFP93_103179 [Aneurinibacillus soli]|uniref:Uncharacterized protein n=1 Tax=Aneurinibacillus soli TaxID=1500254 RepID=A0A0U5BE45_9BACL|nr:hypothetical protein [Aneurinibacillus soli]PYE62968.1 hypothetical protein DFP93_103179 [Aneurinibacillus soli]BAU28973.1 hypothetical protein CB4_03151 [Aneurinibacillus soli]
MSEVRLSDFIGKGSQLLFSFPLYKKIKINTSIETKHGQDVTYHGDDDDYPDVIDYIEFLENKDFSYFKTLFFTESQIFLNYCPSCDREVHISYKGFKLEDKYEDNVLVSEADISCDEHYDFCHDKAKSKFNEMYNELTKKVFGSSRTFQINFECTAKEKHKSYVIFHLTDDGYIVKIGQYPSIADFDNTAKRYRKALGDKKLAKEFHTAVGLKANGVGVGSFVYLRRIFEKLIFDKIKEVTQADSSIKEDDFVSLRMKEKIEKLKDHLPEFLVNNPVLYSILSKGVHELTDKECLAHFDTVRAAIILILEEKLEKEEREKRKKIVSKELQNIHSEYQGS